MRIALDTNILGYIEGLLRADGDELKIARSRAILAQGSSWSVAAQTLAELHLLLVRRLALSREDAAERIARWLRRADIVPTDAGLLAVAFEIAAQHRLPTFDAIILAAAEAGGCSILYSEDFQHGFRYRGLEVVNPFA